MKCFTFEPAFFVGKNADDNTINGLFRRMVQAGQRAELAEDGVTICYEPEAGDEHTWITSVEKHFGCKLVAEV